MKAIHNIKPIFDKNSKILILGSMPSISSRECKFYYANKYNRFWKIIESLFNISLKNNEDKIKFLLDNNIAIFDMIKECDIVGSSDSSIKDIVLNDIEYIVKNSSIKYIFCTGKTSYNLFIKNFSYLNIKCFCLPSPSSANARYSFDNLLEEYNIIKKCLYEFK